MSQTVFGAEAAVTFLNRAFNNTAPGNLIFQNQVTAAGSTATTQFAFASQFGQSFAGLTDAALSTQVLTNIGVLPSTDTAVLALEAELAAYFGVVGADARGIVVLQLAQILSNLEGATGTLAVYAPTATAWNNEVTVSYTYSANPANTAAGDPLIPVVPADTTAPVVTAAQTFSYAENQVADAVVATVAATDVVGVTSFEIKSGNTDGYFAIGADGKISITAAGVAAHVNNFESGINTASLVVVAKDAAGNTSAPATIVLNETNVGEFTTGAAAGTTVKLNFDAALKAGITVPVADFAVTQGSSSFAVTQAEVSGTTVTLTLASAVAATSDVSVNYTGTALVDANNVAVAKQVMKAVPGDIVAPTATLSPVDAATGVATNADIVLTFNEAIVKGAGNITLTNAADATQVVTIDVASSQVTVSADGKTVTVNPTADLTAGVQYNVVLPSGSFKDVAGNNYAGSVGYDFTTSAGAAGPVTLTTGTDVKAASIFDAPALVSVNGVAVQTLGSDDQLTGAGSTDVLSATLNSAINVKPTLSGIETLNFSTIAASNIDLGNATGVTTVNHNGNVAAADLTVLNIAAIPAELGVQTAVNTTDTLFQFQSAALAGATDTVKLKLTSNGVSTLASGNINVAGLGAGVAETLDVTVVGANRIGALSSDTAAGLGVTTATNGVKTYKFSGDGSIRIDTALTGATVVDGSGMTAGTMRVIADPALAVTATGGKGNDFVDFGTGLTIADKFTGGDGRDTLVTSATTNAGLTTGHGISGVEILYVGGTATAGVAAAYSVDSDVTTSFDAFVHNSTGAMTYTNTVGANMADATKGLTVLNTGTVTLNIKGADGLGASSDALYVNIGNTIGTFGSTLQTALQTTGGAAAGALTVANTETITLDVKASADLQTAAGTGVITATTLTTLNIKGGAAGEAFNVGGAAAASIVNAGNGLVKIDGSGFAGNLTVHGTNVGQSISAGSGNDLLGTGDSAAFGAAVSKDILTGGAGNDIFSFRGNDATIAGVNVTTMDALAINKFIGMASITDLNLGGATAATAVDQIDSSFVGGASVAATLGLDTNVVTVVNGGAATALTGVNLGTAVDALVNGGILGAAAVATGVAAGLFTWGTDTFLIASQQAVVNDSFGTVVGSDLIIKVTGVVGTLDAGDFAAFNLLGA